MSKKPSVETELRHAKRDLTISRKAWQEAQIANGRLRLEMVEARGRETKALQEAAEWRKRFDALLERVPLANLPSVGGDA